MIDPELRAILEEMSISVAAIRSRMDRLQLSEDGFPIVRVLETARGVMGTWRADAHSTEDNFQHFLSYTNFRLKMPEHIDALRLAYFHGARESPVMAGWPDTSPIDVEPV